MSGNRTTELLCKLLEERGIEWEDGDAAYEIEWSTPDGRHCSAMYWKPAFSVIISGCTPEQAVAATLGSDTLTAELWSGDDSHMYHVDTIEEICARADERIKELREEYDAGFAAGKKAATLTAEQVCEATYAHSIHADCADADWQAIADELNAWAERTCRMELTDLGSAFRDVWLCSECGEQVERNTVMNESEPPNYCPNCGARVIGTEAGE